jgi:hypothetical protein
VSGGVSDAVTQFASTGRVNLRDVAVSTAIGAVDNGRGRARTSCTHSFAGDTKVLTAGGGTKPIKEIRVGDRVIATDPATGRTEERTVTKQHINRDRDLTDLTVRTADGRTTTVRTTQKHPFWDQKAKQWVAAGALVGAVLFGAQATTADSAQAAQAAPAAPIVDSVANYTGDRIMFDLTVDDIHTYYVVADDTPVLVHNCGGAVRGHPDTCECRMNTPHFAVDSEGETTDLWDEGINGPIQDRRDHFKAKIDGITRQAEWTEAVVNTVDHQPTPIELSDPISKIALIGLVVWEGWKIRRDRRRGSGGTGGRRR